MSKHRGLQYLKLFKRVAYPLQEIKLFESNDLYICSRYLLARASVAGYDVINLMI